MSESKWFIKTATKIQGPYSAAKVRAYAAKGRLKAGMLLSTDKESWLTPSEAGFRARLQDAGPDDRGTHKSKKSAPTKVGKGAAPRARSKSRQAQTTRHAEGRAAPSVAGQRKKPHPVLVVIGVLFVLGVLGGLLAPILDKVKAKRTGATTSGAGPSSAGVTLVISTEGDVLVVERLVEGKTAYPSRRDEGRAVFQYSLEASKQGSELRVIATLVGTNKATGNLSILHNHWTFSPGTWKAVKTQEVSSGGVKPGPPATHRFKVSGGDLQALLKSCQRVTTRAHFDQLASSAKEKATSEVKHFDQGVARQRALLGEARKLLPRGSQVMEKLQPIRSELDRLASSDSCKTEAQRRAVAAVRELVADLEKEAYRSSEFQRLLKSKIRAFDGVVSKIELSLKKYRKIRPGAFKGICKAAEKALAEAEALVEKGTPHDEAGLARSRARFAAVKTKLGMAGQ